MSKPTPTCYPLSNIWAALISSSFEALNYSTWTPKIVMPIATPSIICQALNWPPGLSDEIDIVPLIVPPNLHLRTLCKRLLQYLKGCTFCFAGTCHSLHKKWVTFDNDCVNEEGLETKSKIKTIMPSTKQ